MVANVQAAYERSLRKSLRRPTRELQIPKSTLQRIVHKRLKLYAYKVQLMQRLEPDDKPKRVTIIMSKRRKNVRYALSSVSTDYSVIIHSCKQRQESTVCQSQPRSEELTGARQIHVEAELPHRFRITFPKNPVSFNGIISKVIRIVTTVQFWD
ncbi:hypothetical protein ANN_25115 [Periplaneta americana]|uniref:Transposase Tc1-like domain-containing protein n=1 Tax=Periplaneta americana TaxID=6978 RepID=A0ABQ8S0G2_PERAM|nr:hypothetical protein ANN_25115 [Periplaneta americana]